MHACESEYGLKAKQIEIEGNPKKYSDRDWLYRHESEGNYEISKKLSFGEVTIRFSLNQGMIEEIHVFTDAMVDEFTDWLEMHLKGCSTDEASVLVGNSEIEHCEELAELLEELR